MGLDSRRAGVSSCRKARRFQQSQVASLRSASRSSETKTSRFAKYDKVLFHPRNAIPVDFESDNLLFVVPVDDIVAVFRRSTSRRSDTPDLNAEDNDATFE
jgi:hypothetical protein